MEEPLDRLIKWREGLNERLSSRNFRLDENREPVPCRDIIEWAEWYETADRTVKLTKLSGGAIVSTVFLGTDHSFTQGGPPILFETAVLYENGYIDVLTRYTTWDDAEAGHDKIVKQVCREQGRTIEAEDPLEAEFIV